MRFRHPRRRGAALIVALVLLVLLVGLLTAMVRLGLANRQRLLLDERLAQTEWLAVAGLERAAARLRNAPDFDGEVWEIPESDLGGRASAIVTITVEPANETRGPSATARAELRIPPDRIIRRTRTAVFPDRGGESPSATTPDVTDISTQPGLDAAPEDEP